MKLSNLITAASVTTLLILGGCDDDDLDPIQVFDLVFAGDATFQGAHGGQTIAVAVVQTADGSVVETASGTVSATADPSFSFSFNDILDDGESYEIHYWIDSNFVVEPLASATLRPMITSGASSSGPRPTT